MALNLAGAAAGSSNALQEMLARAFAEQQAKQRMELDKAASMRAADALGLQKLNFEADEQFRQKQAERQATLDAEAASDRARQRSTEQNSAGMRRMIGDFLIQRGSQPIDAGTRNQLIGMSVSDGVELPDSITEDPEADARRAGMIADAQAKAAAKHRQPTQASRQQEWVVRGGQVVPIQAGTAQPGDKPYDPVAARQTQPIDSKDAQQVTQTALGLVGRLKKHPGLGAATGAYELRGFTQPAVDFNAIRNQLVAALALPNLGALRGPMSDKDVLFVKQLATRLAEPRLSAEETMTALNEAELFLTGKLGDGAAVDANAAQGEYDYVPGRGLVRRGQ